MDLEFTSVKLIPEVKQKYLTSVSTVQPMGKPMLMYKISHQICDWLPDVENDLSQRFKTRCEMMLTYNITFSYIGRDPM